MIQSARYIGGSWSSVTDLTNATNENQDNGFIDTVVDDNGDVTVSWESWRRQGGAESLLSCRYSNGSWGAINTISSSYQEYKQSHIAADISGNVMAIWASRDNNDKNYPGYWMVHSAIFRDGYWGVPSNLTHYQISAFGAPQIVADGSGSFTAIWSESEITDWSVVQSARYDQDSWSDVVDLSAAGEKADSPQLAADGNGNVTGVWRRFNGSNWVIQSARYSDGVWSGVTDLSTPGQDSESPQVASDRNGKVTAVWRRFDGNNWIIQGAHYYENTWSSIYNLSVSGQDAYDPRIAGDDNGNVMVVWTRFDGTNWVVQSRRGFEAYTLSVRRTGAGSVVSAPGGVDCGVTCIAAFKQGASVSLTATPGAGYAFGGWSGACAGTGPCVLTMDTAKTVSASFTSIPVGPQSVLNVAIAKGHGIVTSDPTGIRCSVRCSASFTKGTRVRLYATPAEGYKFRRWSGACSGKKPCTVRMKRNRRVRANFVALKKIRRAARDGAETTTTISLPRPNRS